MKYEFKREVSKLVFEADSEDDACEQFYDYQDIYQEKLDNWKLRRSNERRRP